jgi:hypothetical protein
MATSAYTFSKTRMLVHIVLLVITAGGWIIIGAPWELYRAFGK